MVPVAEAARRRDLYALLCDASGQTRTAGTHKGSAQVERLVDALRVRAQWHAAAAARGRQRRVLQERLDQRRLVRAAHRVLRAARGDVVGERARLGEQLVELVDNVGVAVDGEHRAGWPYEFRARRGGDLRVGGARLQWSLYSPRQSWARACTARGAVASGNGCT
jgi:hypothetical protein